jgi:hypothetical protein
MGAFDTASSEIAWTKLLEAAKRSKRILGNLNRVYMTNDEMADLMTVVNARPDVMAVWLRFLSFIEIHGMVDELWDDLSREAKAIGLAKGDVGTVDETAKHDAWLIPAVRQQFKEAIRMEYSMLMHSLDNLTILGSMDYESAFKDAEDYEVIELGRRALLGWAKTGNDAVLKGKKKRGKTNFALLVAEIAMEMGWWVVSNIHVTNAPEAYRYAPRLSDMVAEICRARMLGKNVLIIFDEGGLTWAKIETIRPRNIDLNKLSLCFGKMHANMLFISHYEEMVPTLIAKTASAEFEKKSKKTCFMHITEGLRLGPKTVRGVPATTLEYNPDQLQYFGMDMDVGKMFDFMSSIDPNLDQWEQVLKYTERMRGKMGFDAIEVKDVAVFLRARRCPLRLIGKWLGVSHTTILEWTKNVAFTVDRMPDEAEEEDEESDE